MIIKVRKILSIKDKRKTLYSFILSSLFQSILITVAFVIFILSGDARVNNSIEIFGTPEIIFPLAIMLISIPVTALITLFKMKDKIPANSTFHSSRDEDHNIRDHSYKAIIDHSPVAIIEFDKNLIITKYNPALKQIINDAKNDLKGQNLVGLFNKEFIEIFTSAVAGKPNTHEGWYKANDKNQKKYLTIHAAPVSNADNNAEYGVAVIHDHTSGKESEINLKKTSRFYKLSSGSNRSLLKAKTDYDLIDQICSLLVNEGCYSASSVAFVNNPNNPVFRRILTRGDHKIDRLYSDEFSLIKNYQTPLSNAVKLNKPLSFYQDELFENYNPDFGSNKTVVIPLNGSGLVFGLLLLQTDGKIVIDTEEFNLVNEIASDLAFGLSKFEIEQRHSTVKTALFESEEKFRLLINSIDDIVFTLDKYKKHQGLYGKWVEKLNIKPQTFLGKDANDIFGPEKGQCHLEAADIALAGEHYTYEWSFSDGKKINYFVTTLSPMFDENGDVYGIVGVGKNITELKESTKALEREHLRNRIYLNTTSDGFVLYDAGGKIIEWNKSFSDMIGVSSTDFSKTNIDSYFSPDSDSNQSIKDKSIKIGESTIREADIIHTTGRLVPVEINTSKIILDGQEIFISSVRDLTSRYETEDKLKLLSKAIEHSPAGVIITDASAIIEYINRRYEEITGYDSKELVGKNPKILKSGMTPDSVYRELWKNISSGSEWNGELINTRKNGETYWEHAIISPMFDSRGRATHYIAIKEDISQKKEIERTLIEAKEKAEEMNRLKSNFLANMSHELRTPMIGILGYSELLQSELRNNKELSGMASVIYRAGERLMETLNHILDLSRIEAGNLELNYDFVDIHYLVRESVILYEETAKLKGLEIITLFQDDSIRLSTDPRLLSMALNNLMSNAIKFTPSGSITVGIQTSYVNDIKNILIRVSDTGIGIPKDMHNLIFHEFRQVSEGYSRSFEGTGLGLTLTKKAIELLGGSINVDSEPGAGAVFTVTLPVRKNNHMLMDTESNKKQINPADSDFPNNEKNSKRIS